MAARKISGSLFALTVVALMAGAAHAQDPGSSCGDNSRAVVPDAVAYSDWGDRRFFGEATHKAFIVIRKAAGDERSDSHSAARFVAFGVDVGHRAVLFQITFASLDEVAKFQMQLNGNLLFLSELSSVQDSSFGWGIATNLNFPPPPPPGGPVGNPYAQFLGAQLVGTGEAFFVTEKLALGGN